MAESHFIQVSVDINVSKLRISQSVGSISDALDSGLSGEKAASFPVQWVVIEPSQSFALIVSQDYHRIFRGIQVVSVRRCTFSVAFHGMLGSFGLAMSILTQLRPAKT